MFGPDAQHQIHEVFDLRFQILDLVPVFGRHGHVGNRQSTQMFGQIRQLPGQRIGRPL